ncbi:MAG: rhomboid family intramembrane serine protease [Defluviitaleaceae bacterium]|nr:rhomboid family intramembrane serine protease [Defluviitaleaceae bacterium]
MFTAFSHNFWSLALSQGYKMDYWLGASGAPSMGDPQDDAEYMAFQKVEIATLICLHIIDATKHDWQDVLARDAEHRKWADALLDRVQNVAIIYVLAGEGPPPWHGAQPEGFEDYYGQPAYSVFWWLDITSGAVTVSKNQPAQLFGVRGLMEKARAASRTEARADGEGQDVIPPGGKKYKVISLEPVHRVPFLTIGVIGVNAVILLLMYLAGFPGDMWVPARFGAIVPAYIFEEGEWYRLFTAMFVHFGAGHFFANIMGLIIFGTRVERYFGRVAFTIIYVVSGLLGSLFSLYFTSGYAAGASGAIYGLIGAVFAYTRLTGRSIELMNWYILFMFIGVGIAMGFMTPGVDNFGHLGGLVGGLGIGALMVGVLRLRGRG